MGRHECPRPMRERSLSAHEWYRRQFGGAAGPDPEEGLRVIPDPRRCDGVHDQGMSIVPSTRRVPVVPVVAGALVAQFADDAVRLLLPFPGFLAGVLAVLLTAAAARVVTRGATGATIARTGLAVGLTSAAIGLLVGGLGIVAIVLAGITVVAGVAGAVAGRRVS